MAEEWRPVVGYEGIYSVSSEGRVRRDAPSRRIKAAGHLLNQDLNRPGGYLQVKLYFHGRPKTCRVHVLVAEAFLKPRPVGFQINHRDGNKTHNNLGNLEIVTASENTLHAYRTGLLIRPKGFASGRTPIRDEDIPCIRASTESANVLAVRYGVHHATIRMIRRGLTRREAPSLHVASVEVAE